VADGGSQTTCGVVPPALPWTYSTAGSGSSKTMQFVGMPNNPVTTCSGQNLPNPITFNWVPM
jgi:hypothetical protein